MTGIRLSKVEFNFSRSNSTLFCYSRFFFIIFKFLLNFFSSLSFAQYSGYSLFSPYCSAWNFHLHFINFLHLTAIGNCKEMIIETFEKAMLEIKMLNPERVNNKSRHKWTQKVTKRESTLQVTNACRIRYRSVIVVWKSSLYRATCIIQ